MHSRGPLISPLSVKLVQYGRYQLPQSPAIIKTTTSLLDNKCHLFGLLCRSLFVFTTSPASFSGRWAIHTTSILLHIQSSLPPRNPLPLALPLALLLPLPLSPLSLSKALSFLPVLAGAALIRVARASRGTRRHSSAATPRISSLHWTPEHRRRQFPPDNCASDRRPMCARLLGNPGLWKSS